MPYTAVSQDGLIKIPNVPDDVLPDSDILKQKFTEARAKLNQTQQAETPQPEPDQSGNILNSLLQGSTLGLGDEALAGVTALIGTALPESMGGTPSGTSIGDAYEGIRGEINLDRQAFEARSPKTALAAEIGSGLATGGLGLAKVGGKILTPQSSLFKRLLTNTGIGATEGAIAGAGMAETGERGRGAIVGGTAGAVLGGAGGEAINYFKKSTALKSKLSSMIDEGSTDKAVAKYMADGVGKIKNDASAVRAIDQGFDDGVIAAIKGSSKADKSKMLKMTDLMKRSKDNAIISMKNRPSDIAGDSLMARFSVIQKANKNAGKQLDTVAKSLKKQYIEFTPAINEFTQDLADMGITIGDDLKPIFANSDIEGVVGAQRIVRNIMKRMSDTKIPDAHDGHRLKKFIDEQVTYGKRAQGLGGKTVNILKKLRHNVDSILDDQFPEYNRVNSIYAETIGVMDDLQGAVGGKIDLTGDNANKAMGTVLRRVMSNAQSRVNIMDATDDIDRIARKHGYTMGDDLDVQLLFADELDRVFETQARTSFQGQIKQATTAAGGGKQGITAMAVDKIGGALEEARGINEENAFLAIKDLLKR